MKIPGSNLVVAIISAILAVLVFQAIQSAFFSEMIMNAGKGKYELKHFSLEIFNITSEWVSLGIRKNSQIEYCKLRERESCYSECFRITVSDIKASMVDLEITDEITCEVQRAANSFGNLVKENLAHFIPFFSS